jgi:anti-repressor protein
MGERRGASRDFQDRSIPDRAAARSTITFRFTFSFKGNPVGTTMVDGEVMFHGGDVCKILGYVKSRNAIAAHCKYAKTLKGPETGLLDLHPHGEVFVPESDLYRLTLRSKMPDAEEFQDWICEVVIPTLRKTGRFPAFQRRR